MNILEFTSEYPFGANTYIISCDGEYAIIDPATSPQKILNTINIDIKRFRYIILTHAHFDHILFADEWHNTTGLPISVSKNDAKMLKDPALNCYLYFLNANKGYFGEICELKDAQQLKLGNTVLTIHSSPGHTPGSILIEAKNALFVGDTVFADNGYGRCDLPGGNFDLLKCSVNSISRFHPETVIYPGHGPKTKVSKIIRF